MNKVIIIGTDHHNVLGTVRCFGINKIKPYGIIVKNDKSPIFVTKSRYWNKTWVIEKDDQIYELLKKEFQYEKEKPVIICCSDGAVECIDTHLNDLNASFILPSINSEAGRISALMDKEAQSRFLLKNSIETLDSRIIDLNKKLECDFPLPVILKPVTSIEGEKKDIIICQNYDEYLGHCKKLKRLGYVRLLRQEYLEEKNEYLLTGSVTNNMTSYTLCKNIRQWPLKTGSGCYASFVVEGEIMLFANQILCSLQKIGFTGTIDIELFEDGSHMYVNEINWRTGGRNYVNLYNRVYSTYLYYLNVTGKTTDAYKKNNISRGYIITEGADIRCALFSKEVSLFKWMIQFIKAKSYSLWYIRDLKPTFVRYKYYLKKLLKGSK